MSRVDAKVVILGKSYVGKTCLVNKYVHHRFDPNLPYQNTIGAAFGSKKETVNGKSIVLGIWDTAGHERYESMTRMYYRGAVACILCYDITEKSSFDRARFWAGELKATQEDCMIYLCGTKKDVVDDNPNKREVERRMAEPLATVRTPVFPLVTIKQPVIVNTDQFVFVNNFQSQLYETSSLTGENIDELFKQIAKDIIEKRENAAREIREQEDSVNLYTGRDTERRRGCALMKWCWS